MLRCLACGGEKKYKGGTHGPACGGVVILYSPLTSREKQVLRLRRDGLAPKQIAHTLGTSWETVKHQCSSIIAKLGVNDMHQAVLVDYVMQTYLGEP